MCWYLTSELAPGHCAPPLTHSHLRARRHVSASFLPFVYSSTNSHLVLQGKH